VKTALTARARLLYLLGFLTVLALAWAAPHMVTGYRVRRLGPDGRWITDGSHTDWTGVVGGCCWRWPHSCCLCCCWSGSIRLGDSLMPTNGEGDRPTT
jgi:hypothetical protein